ncbi:MAG: sodium-dependent transporter [Pseudomonadales bacterium]|jgi:NSS family neurotransmitter:Na+ symporter
MALAKPEWTSRFAFLMAAIGSAVGLGNLWRFPFLTGQNGGSAFVAVYLLCVVFVAYPILMGELAIGRHKGLSAVGSTRQLALDSSRSGRWSIVGWIGILAAFGILTTYSVVAGQVIAYSLMSFVGEFAGRIAGDTTQTSLYTGSAYALFWHTIFMAATVAIVSRGLHGGIERVVTFLMPMFFLMLAGLCVYALITGATGEAVTYLFSPDFSALTPSVVLAALGQAFFSIGVGGALMMTYGSFLPADQNIGSNAAIIAGSDTLVAIVAGLMIFPIVFAYGLDPAAGSQLIFDALPRVFADMPLGSVVGGLFFFLAFIAALTTSISILIALSTVGEDQFGLGRTVSAVIAGVLAWVIGTATVLVSGLGQWVDFASGGVLLPLGGLLVAIFAGWVAPRRIMREELRNTDDRLFGFWRLFVRYLAPIAVTLILLLGVDARFDFGFDTFLATLTGN